MFFMSSCDSESIHQLIYVSSASWLLSDAELIQLLQEARHNNESLGVTGMLVYCDGTFIQVLEGERSVVEQLFHRIENDPRHHRCVVLLRQDHIGRAFDGWSMGFRASSRAEVDSLTGYVDFFGDRPVPERGAAAYTLLESFRRQHDVDFRLAVTT
jgi:hypothetical protein